MRRRFRTIIPSEGPFSPMSTISSKRSAPTHASFISVTAIMGLITAHRATMTELSDVTAKCTSVRGRQRRTSWGSEPSSSGYMTCVRRAKPKLTSCISRRMVRSYPMSTTSKRVGLGSSESVSGAHEPSGFSILTLRRSR
jgi:hypothetical protein